METGAVGAGDAVSRPRAYVVRLVGEMGAGIDVVVARSDHVVVLPLRRLGGGPRPEQLPDLERDLGAALDRERAALAKVVLDVDDDECPSHRLLLLIGLPDYCWVFSLRLAGSVLRLLVGPVSEFGDEHGVAPGELPGGRGELGQGLPMS